MSRMKDKYKNEIVATLKERGEYNNVMEVPRIVKVVLNIGVGEAIQNAKALEGAEADLAAITGQHPITTRAKKSIANFRLREGMPVGLKVTLRGERMYEFLDRLVTSALPRVRDFSGIKATGFDGRGNYNLGITEQIIFPEIDIDKINKISGMDITFVTSAETDKEAQSLLTELGLPFQKN